MTAFKIRPAEVSDAERIAYVRVTCWKETYKGQMPEDVLGNLDIQKEAVRIRDVLSDPQQKSGRFVVDIDGEIVGIGACGLVRSGSDPKRGEIYAIYLLSDAKRKGIGKNFMQAMARELQRHGMTSLQVNVLKTNREAQSFYEALGGVYTQDGVFKHSGHEMPEAVYVWEDIESFLHPQKMTEEKAVKG